MAKGGPDQEPSNGEPSRTLLETLRGQPSAARLWGLARELEQHWRPEYLPPLLDILSGRESGFDEQSAAAALLGMAGDRRAIAPLLRKLESAHPSHVAVIVSALGRLRAKEAEPAIARLARSAPRADTKVAAIRALAGIASPKTLRRLERMLSEEPPFAIRAAILTVLQEHGVGEHRPPEPGGLTASDLTPGSELYAQLEAEVAAETDPAKKQARESALRVLAGSRRTSPGALLRSLSERLRRRR